jgi:hypothetical protein
MRGAEPATFEIVGCDGGEFGGVIEPRLYRVAFVPALLAAVLAAFSLQSRPRPLSQGLAADVLFEGDLAARSAQRIAATTPDRRAGRPGDRTTAELVAGSLERRGFTVERDAFSHAGRSLVNVVARRAGRSRRQLVLVAGRDAGGVPDAAGSAADTAALLELARVFQGRPTRRTLLLASVDGSSLGEVGAERLARSLGDPDLVDAVLVVSDLGSPTRRGSLIVPWSSETTRTGIGLQRTVADSIREELDVPVGGTGAVGQLFRLAFPLGIGAQGPFLEHGFEAVRISGSGELPSEEGGAAAVDQDQLGGLGRATLRAVTAIDQSGRAEGGAGAYLTAVSQVMPGWAIALLAFTLLLPALVTAVDAFARARRRRLPILPWLRWLAVWSAPFAAALAGAELLALVGATPEPPPAPVAPADFPLDGPAIAVLCGVAAIGLLVFLLARRLVVRPDAALADPAQPGAGCALALATSAAAALLWVVNPFAVLMALPAVHLWLLATLVEPAPRRRARAAMVAVGALPPLLVVLYHLFALHVDPLSGAWYLLLLVTGHVVGLISALVGCVWLGALCAALAIVRAKGDPEPPAPAGPSVYGPGTYAGPGSLGGTESALRR